MLLSNVNVIIEQTPDSTNEIIHKYTFGEAIICWHRMNEDKYNRSI